MKKKTVLESLKDFLQNVQYIFSIFFFVFYWKRKKHPPPLCPFFAPHFFWGGGGSSAASPLKNWDIMTPYLKILFEQKNRNLIILTIFAWTIPLNDNNCVQWLNENNYKYILDLIINCNRGILFKIRVKLRKGKQRLLMWNYNAQN